MEFEKLFIETKRQPITYQGKELKMIERVDLPSNKVTLKVSFLSTDSKWKQRIVFQTKGEFEVNGQKLPTKIVLWEDTAPKELQLLVKSKNKVLVTYNVWQTEDGTTHYWHNGGAMYLEEKDGVRTYNCNDGYPDDDLNDLVFTVEYL
ncbi:hypothetical protein [Sphingobacterium endophyticum]|uniref:hypothetical protein n=1 Tax=Sphingobacterium endophyticum TaxID=2546448 RepID=UPI0012E313CB|nr:hypothetical protein [Sphingobacterium endophyticum]